MRLKEIVNYIIAAALFGANLCCLNLLLKDFRAVRVDLTEGRVFTLAPQTKALLQEPEEPLEIYFYYSPIEKLHEKLRPLVGVLSDTLKEFEAASDGKVTTHIVEWDSADKATQERASDTFGVRPTPIRVSSSDESAVRNTYFAVVVSYGDQYERYDHGQLWRIVEQGSSGDFRVELLNVEYLVAKAIHKVVRGFDSIGASLATKDLQASLRFFFTPEATLPKHLQKVPGFAKTVAKKLASESMGRMKTEFIDPSGDDKKALRAELRQRYGIHDIILDLEAKEGFFSWALITVGESSVPLPLVTLGDEMSEADVREAVTGQLKVLIPGFMTAVGVVTPDPAQNPMGKMMGQPDPPSEFRELIPMLQQEFDVKEISLADPKPIPREISALVLVRPQDYSDKALYEIDQFVMRGGRLIVCADSYSFDIDSAMATRNLLGSVKQVNIGKLTEMLRSYGAEITNSMILDQQCEVMHFARPGKSGRRNDVEFIDLAHPYTPTLTAPNGFNASHPITAKQDLMTFHWATPVNIAKAEAAAESRPAKPGLPSTVKATELAWTSAKSSTSTDLMRAKEPIDSGFGYTPPADAKKQCVAVVLEGEFPSFFADKPIPGKETPASKPADSKAGDEDRVPRLKQSRKTSVVVIGDSDFCSPLVELQAFNLPQETLLQNLQILRNSIDYGGREQELMAIRNRERVQRPLTGLRSLDKDQRKSAAQTATNLALWIPIFGLIAFGVTLAVLRSNRRPLALPRRDGAAA